MHWLYLYYLLLCCLHLLYDNCLLHFHSIPCLQMLLSFLFLHVCYHSSMFLLLLHLLGLLAMRLLYIDYGLILLLLRRMSWLCCHWRLLSMLLLLSCLLSPHMWMCLHLIHSLHRWSLSLWMLHCLLLLHSYYWMSLLYSLHILFHRLLRCFLLWMLFLLHCHYIALSFRHRLLMWLHNCLGLLSILFVLWLLLRLSLLYLLYSCLRLLQSNIYLLHWLSCLCLHSCLCIIMLHWL